MKRYDLGELERVWWVLDSNAFIGRSVSQMIETQGT